MIYVDADACPNAIKELIFRAAIRREIVAVVVANQTIAVPQSPWVKRVTVRDGADQADHWIAENTAASDVVITDDIPLAARVIEKEAMAISSRGDLYDEKNIHSRLASRDLMEQLRLSGMELTGPKPHTSKDAQRFANQLDRTLTKLSRSA